MSLATEWQPGDPLYPRPKAGTDHSQHVRPMVEVLADLHEYAVRQTRRHPNYCPNCEVTGSRPVCWFCGADLGAVA